MSPSSSYQDTSTDCAICLESLDDNDKKTITLTCGHRWHLDCLRQQLQTAKPSATKRLLFSGCQCAKCGVICEHRALEELTRTTDTLREKVNVLLKEQLDQNGSDMELLSLRWKQVNATTRTSSTNNDKQEEDKILQEARRKLSFYLCSHCQEPYFGGTVECADSEEREELRLCVACTPQVVCRHPIEHLSSIVWKCRYCCQPATHVCYGNVHFCNACHGRNSQRVHQRQRSTRNGGSKPPPLTAIPCPGRGCPFPKPPISSYENEQAPIIYHANGSSPDCEQVYACVRCQSSSSQNAHYEAPGSHNLLTNPSGDNGMHGWRQLNRAMAWTVEESEIPVNASTSTNFVSSFHPCVMCQTLDLTSLDLDIANRLDTDNFRIQVSARYMARTDCPSVFRLETVVMNRQQQPLQRLATGTLEAPPDYWEIATLTLEHVSLQDAKYVNIVIFGQDRRFWQGKFGSKVVDCSIRILWGDNNDRRHSDGNASRRALEPIETANHTRAENQQPNNDNNFRHDERQDWFLRELVIPVACFILLLAWLIKD
jgi:hypothetical protein